jgi:hypothetical protein
LTGWGVNLTQAPLVLGEIDTSMYTGTLSYTTTQKTMGSTYGYYLAEVTDFTIGGSSSGVDVSGFNTYGGMVVDSGTTELLLPEAQYVAFAKYLMTSVSWMDKRFFEVRPGSTLT